MNTKRDHGGGIDAAVAAFGGTRAGWIDLSTGINPVPYTVGRISSDAWQALPDQAAMERLLSAARRFWSVPDGAAILAAPGCSALIAQIPYLAPKGHVSIATRTYNEHAAAFRSAGWQDTEDGNVDAQVIVHPNNPDGAFGETPTARLAVIDESFCDVTPGQSLIAEAAGKGRIILKSFGKFWGLAGLRLGFAIGDPSLIATLKERLGPWAVSGPALEIGAAALDDETWAHTTRTRLNADAARLDELTGKAGFQLIGGTSLFRLYDAQIAADAQAHLARHHIWSRIFPYSDTWLRLGIPGPKEWERLSAALATLPR